MRKPTLVLIAIVLLAVGALWPQLSAQLGGDATPAPGHAGAPAQAPSPASFLPPQALETIALIQRGGPFPHRQDGSVFGNREGRLPAQSRGYYREYTVATPGLSHRGARRIVTGGTPPDHWYYTDDHYDSFRAFQPAAGQARR